MSRTKQQEESEKESADILFIIEFSSFFSFEVTQPWRERDFIGSDKENKRKCFRSIFHPITNNDGYLTRLISIDLVMYST